MKIGFLPLYIKLYDDRVPAIRPRLNAFYSEVAELIRQRGVEVVESPFCRLDGEFREAVASFEAADVDAIVTLHMAYSPSLESIDALCETNLPIVVLDTTSTLEFTNMQNPAEIDYCHGIHGVMDMCSMLTRRGKEYAIAAGHYLESDCIDRVLGFVRAAISAKALKNAKVGLMGGAFAGMGDFRVPYEELKERFGIQISDMDPDQVRKVYDSVSQDEIDAEAAENRERCTFSGEILDEEYAASLRACIALRKCVQMQKLTSFSANFMRLGREDCGLDSMPFLECCKAMERGIGYAGEGDALTAAFVGAFLQGYPETTFVEIFCPDWKNNMVFLSHMGEVNYRIVSEKPMIRRLGVNYTPGQFPYAGFSRMKGGKGVYVNVSRGKDDYKLVVAPAEMLDYDTDNFPFSERGWMKPEGLTCAQFLEGLSRNGATHHSAFLYGATAEQLEYFGKLLGLETVVL